jgi:hypothetical protein
LNIGMEAMMPLTWETNSLALDEVAETQDLLVARVPSQPDGEGRRDVGFPQATEGADDVFASRRC